MGGWSVYMMLFWGGGEVTPVTDGEIVHGKGLPIIAKGKGVSRIAKAKR